MYLDLFRGEIDARTKWGLRLMVFFLFLVDYFCFPPHIIHHPHFYIQDNKYGAYLLLFYKSTSPATRAYDDQLISYISNSGNHKTVNIICDCQKRALRRKHKKNLSKMAFNKGIKKL